MRPNISRRGFAMRTLGAAGLALAGCAGTSGGTGSGAQVQDDEPSAGALVSTDNGAQANGVGPSFRTFDMHADTLDALGMVGHKPYSGFNDKFQGSLWSSNCQVSADRMDGVPWVQCYAIWLPDDNGDADMLSDISHIQWYREAVGWFKEQMEQLKDTFEQVRSFKDIPRILEAGKVAAVLTVENAACLDEGIEVVDEFEKDGVLIAGITWNGRNVLGCGNTFVDEGLTSLGKQYVTALEDHGIVVDVSHLNEKGFWDVEKVARKPYVATHSNSRAVCSHLRNLTDDQFKALTARGGVVSLNFHDAFVRDDGFVYTFDELAAHVDHWLELGGEDAIALGNDRDGGSIPTWLADCSSQAYLFERFAARVGEDVAHKLFFQNAMRFFAGE